MTASPPSVIYLSRKFIRRHRASVSLAGILGVALVVTIGIAAMKWRKAGIERDRAQASTNRVAYIGDFLLDILLLSADSNSRNAAPIISKDAMVDIADRANNGLADDPDDMLPMLVSIGRLQLQSGHPDLGAMSVADALEFAINEYGIPSPQVVEIRMRLHDVLWGHGLAGWKEQIKLADSESAQLFDDDNPRRMRILQRSQGSMANLERIIQLYDEIQVVDPADHYQSLFALCMKQRFSQTPSDQLETAHRLYEVAKENYPPDHTAVIDSMSLYGDVLSVYAPS